MESWDIIGTPTERWIWLAPDWSASGSTQKDRSWTHVKVRDVRYKDGRVVTYVLDANGQPVAPGGVPAPDYQRAQVLAQDVDKETADAYQRTAPKPLPPGASPTQRQPDGTINAYNPQTGLYDTPTGQVAVTPRTPDQQRSDAANAAQNEAQAQSEQALNAERQWNSQHGYGWVTHAQRAEQVRQAEAQARADKNQDRLAAAQEAQNQLARDRLQFDKDKANLPDVKASEIKINGQTYTRVTAVTPQGTTTIKNYGPDGKEVAALPGEGTGAQGPALPHIVLGQSQAALRTFRDQLNQQVAAGIITPAVADKRWKEATDIAGFAIQEAQTLQRDEESRRNADVNLRTNAMSNATSGFNSALQFVQDLNSKLPEGSTAGGKALEAILGMQQINARRLGAFDNPFSGGAPRSQEARGIDAATASTIATTNSEIGRLTAPGAAVAPTTPAAPVAPAATPTASAPTSAPTPPSTTLPPGRPDQTQAAPQIENAINPPASGGLPPLPATPDADPLLNVIHTPTGTRKQVRLSELNTAANRAEYQVLDPNSGGSVTPDSDPGQGFVFSPIPGTQVSNMKQDAPSPAPSSYGESGDVSMAPGGEDFAALAPFGRSSAPSPVYPQLAPPDPGVGDFAAMRRAQIASTPPWRLSDSDLQWAQENGLLDEAMRVPGRRIA